VQPPHAFGSWTLRPALSTHGRGDDGREFRARLVAALRAGHGLGVGFRLRVVTGPGASVTMDPDTSDSMRWMARVLVPAYQRHQWLWSPRSCGIDHSGEGWDGNRSRPWPDPFRSAADGPPAIDSLVMAFSTIPTGGSCEWSFRPLPLSHPTWWEILVPASEPPPCSSRTPIRVAAQPPQNSEVSRERPTFWLSRVQVDCESRMVSSSLVRRVARAIESTSRVAGGNGLRVRRRPWWSPAGCLGFPMSDIEVAVTLPSPDCPTSEVINRPTSPDDGLLPLGRTAAGLVVGPRIERDQGRHLAVLGETGMGKSSLLVALARRIGARSGLVLFDPLGETAHSIRQELPARAEGRVTWIDPAGSVRLNALAGLSERPSGGDAYRERRLNDLVCALRRVRSGRYAESGFWGPRLEEMLTRALSAASSLPGGTLVDAHTLLASGGRGFRTAPPEAMDDLRALGDRIRSRPEDAEGARRLLYEVSRSPVLVRMLCAQDPTLGASDLVTPGRIVLISGEAGTVGESTSRYLLSIYLALVWSELLARPNGAKTFVVLDEAQWFAHESLSEMLRLGRRRNVHVVLATQSIGSLPEAIRDAVWTNVSDFVAFRGAPAEAREFSRATNGLTAEALLSLPRGEAVALLGKGNSVHWIRSARRPPRLDDELGPSPAPALSRGDNDSNDPSDSEPAPLTVPDSPVEVTPWDVLRAVARIVDRAPTDGPVPISLTELRAHLDPAGEAVRAAGAILGRSRAICRNGRDASGSCWWIDPERFARVLAESGFDATKTDSSPPQPS
jgi:hypothetical protein